MTNLADRITRLKFQTAGEVRERGRYRAVSIEARPMYAVVRLSGMRSSFTVPWEAVYHLGAKMQADSVRKEKKARRLGK